MEINFGGLSWLVASAGVVVVAIVLWRVVKDSPDEIWENTIALIFGAGLLVWPIAQGASLLDSSKDLEQIEKYRQILDLGDLSEYRLTHGATGKQLRIVIDQASGEIRLEDVEEVTDDNDSTAEDATEVNAGQALEDGGG